VSPAAKDNDEPLPEPLLPTLISIDPADAVALSPLLIEILPEVPNSESPESNCTLPDEVSSDPSTTSAQVAEFTDTSPLRDAVLLVTENRRP
jgi:hypothetical protein